MMVRAILATTITCLLGACAPSGHQVSSSGSYNFVVTNTSGGNVDVGLSSQSDSSYEDLFLGIVGPGQTAYFTVSTGRWEIIANHSDEGSGDFSPDHVVYADVN